MKYEVLKTYNVYTILYGLIKNKTGSGHCDIAKSYFVVNCDRN